MGRCAGRDRTNAVSEEYSFVHRGRIVRVHTWEDGGLLVDVVIRVTLGSWEIARLDCAHNEIHTHFFGFEPEPTGKVRERERKVHTELPLDARSAAYVINSAWPMCYQVMIGVAEGRRP